MNWNEIKIAERSGEETDSKFNELSLLFKKEYAHIPLVTD